MGAIAFIVDSATVGGRTLEPQGPPAMVDGTITFAGDIRYRRDSTWMTGQPANMGLVATIRSGGVSIIVSSERTMPFDTLHLRLPGVDPARAKMITMKCGSAWSTAFGHGRRPRFCRHARHLHLQS